MRWSEDGDEDEFGSENLPVGYALVAVRRHAVHLPVDHAVLVADLDREAAIVGPDQLDGFAQLALDLELLLLAGVKGSLALWSAGRRRIWLAAITIDRAFIGLVHQRLVVGRIVAVVQRLMVLVRRR